MNWIYKFLGIFAAASSAMLYSDRPSLCVFSGLIAVGCWLEGVGVAIIDSGKV